MDSAVALWSNAAPAKEMVDFRNTGPEETGLKLWIGNIAPGTTDEELREFLAKYGVSAIESIEHVPGDGSRPAAALEVAASPEALKKVTQRLNGMYWKGRTLTVQAMTR